MTLARTLSLGAITLALGALPFAHSSLGRHIAEGQCHVTHVTMEKTEGRHVTMQPQRRHVTMQQPQRPVSVVNNNSHFNFVFLEILSLVDTENI